MGHIRDLGKDRAKRWKARYRAPDGKERSRSFATKAEAESFLAKMSVARERGTWTDPRKARTPFEDFARTFLEAKSLSIRPATQSKYESGLKHLVKAFGQRPIGKISRGDVQDFVKAMTAGGSAPATVRISYTLLGMIMKDAVEEGLIPRTPCRSIVLPRMEKVERRFLSALEVERLAEAIEAPYGTLIRVAGYGGLRWEEVAALKRANLNLDAGTLHVVAVIERDHGKYRYVEITKTEAGSRAIRLPGFLLKELRNYLKTAPESEWVFPAKKGGHLRYDLFRRREWAAAVEATGLAPVGFHALRHTAAAMLINSGADPIQVQRRLGHADVRVTLGTYGHLFAHREDDLNDRLERVHKQAVRKAAAASSRPTVVDLDEARAEKMADEQGKQDVDLRRIELLTSPVRGVNEGEPPTSEDE